MTTTASLAELRTAARRAIPDDRLRERLGLAISLMAGLDTLCALTTKLEDEELDRAMRRAYAQAVVQVFACRKAISQRAR